MGNDAGGDLSPTVVFGSADERVAVVARTPVSASLDGKTWNGEGEVRLELRPRPSVRVHCVFDDGVTMEAPAIRLESNPARLAEMTVGGRKVNGLGMKARVWQDDDGVNLAVKWSPDEPLQGLGDEATQVRRVRFSLFNLRFRGTRCRVDGGWRERFELENSDWLVRIGTIAGTQEAWRRMAEEGGDYLTHAGEFERKDGTVFTGAEARNMVEALEQFLSLSSGTPTVLCCPVGTDEGGEEVWSWWSSPRAWQGTRMCWFDGDDTGRLGEFFRGFTARWQDETLREDLREVVYWYVLANDSSRDIDAGIVCAQTALERLSYGFCVEERKLVSKMGFNKLPAMDQIRLVLGSLRIPLDIPSSARGLSTVRNRNWVDGPEAVTQMRNDLVHGGKKRSELSAECYVDAWRLVVWFVELGVLSLCGYRGGHWNRNSEARETVPWC